MALPSADRGCEVVICRWADIPDKGRLTPQIDAIFFESSNTKDFADDGARSAFRERWLGRYLANEPQFAYVALAGDGAPAGYLVGSLLEPVGFEAFADAAWEYPALFAGAPGMHIITSADSRNVGFYTRNGFAEVARASIDGRELVFLGRKLGVAETA
jgi:hypothetical protein